ncbi:MAG: Asp-tRNA(Asn)/Glu-tRNA(Gln) amidotransferase subunit GatB [Bacteroidia bacterium]
MPTSEIRAQYQTVIGLEIHVQLLTNSKIFAQEGFSFGSLPNHHVSVITMAHPGALPSINRRCIDHAVKIGLATHCQINRNSFFARKNYFYPDLPKGYQMSQDTDPICTHGFIDIRTESGSQQKIRIGRIHLEEDAGKSLHDQDPHISMIDLNRAGVGLVEIVTEPDLRSAEDAATLLAEIRRLVRFLEISDGNMEEGSLRCDANISVMPVGSETLGTRVEVKNMNSFNHLTRAILYESERQIALIEAGGKVVQETRTWDVNTQKTSPMRQKETADDYRYFPEPDLLPLGLTEEYIEKIRSEIPRLPQELYLEYTESLQIAHNEAMTLTEQKNFADYFEAIRKLTPFEKEASNWLLGPVRAWLNDSGKEIGDFPISTEKLADLIRLVQEDKISNHAARDQVFPIMLVRPEESPLAIAGELNILLESKQDEVENAMIALMNQFPQETTRYRSGKKGLKGFFVGHIMRQFQGKASPREVNDVVERMLG